MKCKPILSPQQAADFLANCFTREYRAKCLLHFRNLHGDEYADQVKRLVEQMFKARKKRG